MISAAKKKDVLIEPRFKPDKTPSGLLYLPQQARERCTTGIVKYIGSEVKDVAIGDYVSFSGYSGTLARINGELLIIMPEKEIDFKFTIGTGPDFNIYKRVIVEHEHLHEMLQDVNKILSSPLSITDLRKVIAYVIANGPFVQLKYADIFRELVSEMKTKAEFTSFNRRVADDEKKPFTPDDIDSRM